MQQPLQIASHLSVERHDAKVGHPASYEHAGGKVHSTNKLSYPTQANSGLEWATRKPLL